MSPALPSAATVVLGLPPDARRRMARRAGSRLTVRAGSHAVPVSQPTAVADVVFTAARVLG